MLYKKLVACLIIFNLFSLVAVGQDKVPENYISYHKKINRAETLFFMENKVDSSLALVLVSKFKVIN